MFPLSHPPSDCLPLARKKNSRFEQQMGCVPEITTLQISPLSDIVKSREFMDMDYLYIQ